MNVWLACCLALVAAGADAYCVNTTVNNCTVVTGRRCVNQIDICQLGIQFGCNGSHLYVQTCYDAPYYGPLGPREVVPEAPACSAPNGYQTDVPCDGAQTTITDAWVILVIVVGGALLAGAWVVQTRWRRRRQYQVIKDTWGATPPGVAI